MKIKYSLDSTSLPKKISIIQSQDEDIAYLAEISKRLLIENPSLDFCSAAKLGLMDQYDDVQYQKMLTVAKRLNLLFYDEEKKRPLPEIGLFDLTIRLLYEYLLNHHDEESRTIPYF